MQILIMAALVAAQILTTHANAMRLGPVVVTAVADGNTINVSTIGRVRLLGIDAPKAGRGVEPGMPFGREARERLEGLVLHRWIYLEFEGADGRAANHRAAYVVTGDGQFVNAVLVREGLARVSVPSRVSAPRLAELTRAEADARASRRGLWGSAAAGYTRPSGAIRSSAPKTNTPTTQRKKKKP